MRWGTAEYTGIWNLFLPQVHEMLADVLLDMHNIHHYQRFMSQVREEIQVSGAAFHLFSLHKYVLIYS